MSLKFSAAERNNERYLDAEENTDEIFSFVFLMKAHSQQKVNSQWWYLFILEWATHTNSIQNINCFQFAKFIQLKRSPKIKRSSNGFFFFHFCIVEIKRKREETKKYRTRASIKFVLWIAEDLQSYRVHNPPLIFNGIFECFVWFTILIHLVNTHFCVGPVKWDCFFCTARSRCISLIVNNTKWWHCLLSVIPFESQIESELFKMWGGICFPFRWLSLVIMIAAISKSFDWNPDTELKWSCNYHKLC